MQREIATDIIAMYLKQDFLPAVDAAISQAVSERKVMRHMSGIISKHMALGMIKSTITNSNDPSKRLQQKVNISEDKSGIKQEDKLKVPHKKEKRGRNKSQQQLNLEQGRENSDGKSQMSQLNTNSSMLVKLSQTIEEDSDYIAEIRKIKERLHRFNQQKEERGSFNQNKKKLDYQKKKKHAGECLYHTYDYQSNPLAIVRHGLEPTYNFEDVYRIENSSLLENVQNHLEDQIQLAKNREKQKQTVESRKISSHLKKHIVPQYEMPNSFSINMKAMNPEVPIEFHASHIDSLSKDIENFLSQGIKMITHQEKIYEDKEESKSKHKTYKIKEERIIKEKFGSKKSSSPKSHASSSVIYSLEQESRSCCNNRKQTAEPPQNAHSVQLHRQIEESRFQPITQILRRREDKKYTLDLSTASRADIKLPNINMFIKDKSMSKKRTATEQKMIKGLSSIEVDLKLREKDSRIEGNQRSGLFSAFHLHKPTESSLDEMDSQRPLLSNRNKPKKQYLKEYFNNYRQQFRHRMDSVSKVTNLYA